MSAVKIKALDADDALRAALQRIAGERGLLCGADMVGYEQGELWQGPRAARRITATPH